MSIILTCNAGSSNTKLALFEAKTLMRVGSAKIENKNEVAASIRDAGQQGDLIAIGHRVVHGGREFTEPERITNNVLAQLKSFISLAPLHQPVALKLIEECLTLHPNLPQYACFDTAFHQVVPEIERRLPLPRTYHDEGILRYGFHGISYQYIASVLPKYAGEKAGGRVIAAHLGGGSSICAMKNLKSVATTMGFSTLDGLMMSTRPGALDAGVILHLLQEKKMSLPDVTDLLYHKSGLKGVSGISGDMRELTASKTKEASEAIDLYCYIAARHLGSLLPALGGLDVVVFTGGIGEHSAIVRDKILCHLRWLGDFPVYIIPTDEEAVIAHACKQRI